MALRAHARGGPEQLTYEQAPRSAAGPGEALIVLHAATITFAELDLDLSWTTRDGPDRTPVIPSHEMSGTTTGLGVAGLAVGGEVIGLIDFDQDGAAVEYVVMPAASLGAKPPSVSHEQAAALPLAALTAWQALVDHAALESGEQVLVKGRRRGWHIRRPARGDPPQADLPDRRHLLRRSWRRPKRAPPNEGAAAAVIQPYTQPASAEPAEYRTRRSVRDPRQRGHERFAHKIGRARTSHAVCPWG